MRKIARRGVRFYREPRGRANRWHRARKYRDSHGDEKCRRVPKRDIIIIHRVAQPPPC